MMKECRLINRCGLIGVLLFFCVTMHAQQFSVGSFRLLPNDITAYIAPVKDLNNEACALIKVVGDADFVFSTPLGIVQRKEEVGEIWIYVPNETVQITIKHPQWGVLRDFHFDAPLESRMTYELVLLPPKDYFEQKRVSGIGRKPVKFRKSWKDSSEQLTSLPSVHRWESASWMYLLLANVGISQTSPAWGMRMGIIKRHGGYLAFSSETFSMPQTSGTCDRTGRIDGALPYYTGNTKTGNWKVLAGGIHRLKGKLCLFEGIGFGEHVVAWETSDGDCLSNKGLSTKGLSAELGLLYHFRTLAFTVGVSTINGNYWEATLGLGICL